MKTVNKNKLKRPANYDKITLISPHTKGDYHMFTGLKNQLELSDSLIENILPLDNELIKLKKILNWEGINSIYRSCFNSKKGNKTKTTDIALGLLLLKHLYQKSDRTLIKELHLNNSYMYFCSLSYDEVAEANRLGIKLIDHSTLVKIRKRLGAEKISKILSLFTRELIDKKIIDGRYLFTDTTTLEKNIAYPTEVSLLSRVIEEAAAVVQKVKLKKNIVKTEAIKKAKAISKVYYCTSKKTKKLLKDTTTSLIAIAKKQIADAESAMAEVAGNINASAEARYKMLKEIGAKIISQTEAKLNGAKVLKKIVSYYEPHARALPKGKPNKICEFGTKLSLNMSANGYITNHKLYDSNIADVNTLEFCVKEHKKVFGKKFKAAAADRGYYDKDLISTLENKHKISLAIPHKKNRDGVMTKHKQKIYKKRSAIEAKISEGKRTCGLNKSYYRGFDGDNMWAGLSIMALNIRKILRDMALKPDLILRFA